MAEIKNLIFDFDGTLADTSALIIGTMQKTIEEMGLPKRTDNAIKATIGLRLDKIPTALWPDLLIDKDLYAEIYRKNFQILKETIPVKLFPGVKNILRLLKDDGYGLSIATSRTLHSLTDLTNQLGIKEYFSYLLGGDNVVSGKPDPESIYKILQDTGWKYSETMMVGDMKVDIQMGKNAGIKTCGVTYGNGSEESMTDTRPDFLIDSFELLPEVLKSC